MINNLCFTGTASTYKESLIGKSIKLDNDQCHINTFKSFYPYLDTNDSFVVTRDNQNRNSFYSREIAFINNKGHEYPSYADFFDVVI